VLLGGLATAELLGAVQAELSHPNAGGDVSQHAL